MMIETIDTLATLAVLAAVAYASVRERLSSDADPVTEAKRLYAEGKIDEPELESGSPTY